MFNKTKYVVIEDDNFGELPYVFPNFITHNEFARRLSGRVISAGFCDITKDYTFNAYGNSVSLKLESRECDSALLTRYLLGH
jgi:hypothetical protein